MTFLLYNILVPLALVIYAPIHIVRLILASKYRESTLPRLGFQSYPKADKSKQTFLIHSVSVGETQVAGTLAKEIKEQHPNARIFVSTVTETGQAVARKLEFVDGCFFLPYDLYYLTEKVFKSIQPDALIIIENDLWLNYLHSAKKRNIPCFLVNGKLSESSMRSYKKHRQFGQLLFGPFEHFFVQSQTFANRFKEMGIKDQSLSICGNIKLDSNPPHMNEQERAPFLSQLGLEKKDLSQCLIYGSTHAEEEEMAIDVHQKLKVDFPQLQTIIVPRHPERFDAVAQMIEKRKISFSRTSQIKDANESKDILLVDQMGALMKLYQLGTIGIVCGSFTGKVGAHNFLEPAFYHKPFVYGPHTYSQPGFYQLCQQADAGIQCDMKDLSTVLNGLLRSPQQQEVHGEKGFQIINKAKGAVHHTVETIFKILQDK